MSKQKQHSRMGRRVLEYAGNTGPECVFESPNTAQVWGVVGGIGK